MVEDFSEIEISSLKVGNVASIAMTSKIFVLIFGKLISCKRPNNFINYHHTTIRTGDTQCYRILYKNNLQQTTKTILINSQQ